MFEYLNTAIQMLMYSSRLFLHHLPASEGETKTDQSAKRHRGATRHRHPHHTVLLQPARHDRLQFLVNTTVSWFIRLVFVKVSEGTNGKWRTAPVPVCCPAPPAGGPEHISARWNILSAWCCLSRGSKGSPACSTRHGSAR